MPQAAGLHQERLRWQMLIVGDFQSVIHWTFKLFGGWIKHCVTRLFYKWVTQNEIMTKPMTRPLRFLKHFFFLEVFFLCSTVPQRRVIKRREHYVQSLICLHLFLWLSIPSLFLATGESQAGSFTAQFFFFFFKYLDKLRMNFNDTFPPPTTLHAD